MVSLPAAAVFSAAGEQPPPAVDPAALLVDDPVDPDPVDGDAADDGEVADEETGTELTAADEVADVGAAEDGGEPAGGLELPPDVDELHAARVSSAVAAARATMVVEREWSERWNMGNSLPQLRRIGP